MTNSEIINNAMFSLLDAGIIQSTGRMLECVDGSGNHFTTPEPEQIHTFMVWKDLGYSVKKGSKAVCKLTIWKHVTRQPKPEDGADTQPESRMFMKTAAFFAAHQVEPISQEGRATA